jgi:protein-tyrosine kinase
MDMIEAAIARARTARSAQGRLARDMVAIAAETAARSAASAAAAAPPEPDGSAQVAAAWRALAQVRLDPNHLQRNRILTSGSSPGAVPFDIMRTRLLQQMRAQGWRRVAVTSPTAHCGKSTVAANLALSLARQKELRVILAEADMRRPSLGPMLGIDERHSFGHVLRGDEALAENALRSGENLALAITHRPIRDRAEILQGPGASLALARIEAAYDPALIVFDMPPMLAGDDVMAFAACVDCVLLVAAAEATTIKEIDVCERALAQHTNVLGVVLNKCRYLDQSYGHYG